MSIPYFCSECHDVIGEEPREISLGRLRSGYHNSEIEVECPGRGNHPEPKRTERKKLFRLIRKVTLTYPETRTTSSWEEYAGPANKFCLWFAIVFGTRRYPNGSYQGVTVNGKWAWWDLRTGFYGDGVQELASA
ncbi:MAG: hypothetical protein Q7R94_03270 [bacterium]|nr:hypothetical protein [bacterium]